jgi:predicted DNA-binding ribbon-helix-helix protein
MKKLGEKTEKRSVTLNGRKTSLTIKPSIWSAFVKQAKTEGRSTNTILSDLMRATNGQDMPGAIRRYVADHASEPLYNFATREQWLGSLIEAMRPAFAAKGYTLPETVKVSVGFPSTGYRGKRLGECWPASKSAKGWTEIFISPLVDGETRLANILTHELCHAAIGCKGSHGKLFRKVGEAMQLEGPPKSMLGGAAWLAWATPILDAVGPIPHAPLAPYAAQPKKQTTRMLKCECPECGAIWRTSAKVIKQISLKSASMCCIDPLCDGQIPLDTELTDEDMVDEGE